MVIVLVCNISTSNKQILIDFREERQRHVQMFRESSKEIEAETTCRICTIETDCQNMLELVYSDQSMTDIFYYCTRIEVGKETVYVTTLLYFTF